MDEPLIDNTEELEEFVSGYQVGQQRRVISREETLKVLASHRSRFRPSVFLREWLINVGVPFNIPVVYAMYGPAFVTNRTLVPKLIDRNHGVRPLVFLPWALTIFIVCGIAVTATNYDDRNPTCHAVSALITFIACLLHAVNASFIAVKYALMEPALYAKYMHPSEVMLYRERSLSNMTSWLTRDMAQELLVHEVAAMSLMRRTLVTPEAWHFCLRPAADTPPELQAGLRKALLPEMGLDAAKRVDVGSTLPDSPGIAGIAALTAIATHCKPSADFLPAQRAWWRWVASFGMAGAYLWRIMDGTLINVFSRDGEHVDWDMCLLNLSFFTLFTVTNGLIFLYLNLGCAEYQWRAAMIEYVDDLIAPRVTIELDDRLGQCSMPIVSDSRAYVDPRFNNKNLLAWVKLRMACKGVGAQFLNRVSFTGGVGILVVAVTSGLYIISLLGAGLGGDAEGSDDSALLSTDWGYVWLLVFWAGNAGFALLRTVNAGSMVNDATDKTLQQLVGNLEHALAHPDAWAERREDTQRIESLVRSVCSMVELDDKSNALLVLGLRADAALLTSIVAVLLSGVAALIQNILEETLSSSD